MDHLLLHLLLLLPPPVPCTSPLSLFWRLKGTAPWSDRSAIITTLYASSSFSWSDRTLFPPDLAAFARETSCLFSPFFRPPPHWSPLGSISLSISLSPVSSFPFHTSTPLCSSLPTRLISHLSSPPCSCKLGWVPQLDPPSCNCASSSSSSVGRSFCTIQTLASFLECPLYLPSIKCIASTWEKDGVPALDRRRPLLAILRCCCWWWWWLTGGHHGGFGFDISPVDPIPNVQLENDCLLLPCMCEGLFFSFFFFALTVVSVRERTSHGFWGEKFAIIIWPCPKLSLREHWIRARIARPKRSGRTKKIGRHALGTAHIMLGRLYQLPPHMHASTSNFSNASD